MLNFFKSHNKFITEVSLWFLFVSLIVFGWKSGYDIAELSTINNSLGGIIGLAIGLLVFVGTAQLYVAIISLISLDENLELLNDKITPQEYSSNEASSSNETNSSNKSNFIDQASSIKENKAPW